MNKTLSRVLLVIAGVLLVIAGIVCLRNPDVALGSMSLILGFAMLFSGIVDILVFAWAHNYIAGSGWFLLDGIVTVLLSLFVLCNDLFTAIALPFIFSMWLLFSGIAKFVNSFDLQRLGVRGWGWFTALGVMLAAAGFLSLLSPMTSILAMAVIVGVLLVIQGIAFIVRGCFSSRLWQ
ncbi:MAG: DUF308 domain-containing protein [Clostridiales bacterium]|nr:DUF308 domain-containing protein [Clostridiales bacterium]